jgi:hypothetical protein
VVIPVATTMSNIVQRNYFPIAPWAVPAAAAPAAPVHGHRCPPDARNATA